MNLNFTNEGLNVEVESISKNEYIALELTRCWATGLANRSGLYMRDILANYDKALKHLEGKDENS